MNHQSDTFQIPAGKAAGAKLFWQKWLPDATPKAVIVLVHGYAEHSGRYEHVAAHLVDNGYAVYGFDHWGHGRSEGQKGTIPAFSVLLDGLDAFFHLVAGEQPDTPLAVIGHSMGGLITTLYLSSHSDRFAIAVLSGPAVVVAEPPSAVTTTVARLLSKVAPRVGVAPALADGVSRDPAVVAAYKADPLVYHGKVQARMGYELMNAMEQVPLAAPNIALPILILHGDHDALAAPEGAKLLDATVSSEDKKLVLYPGLHHEIFNEPEKQQVFDDMTKWLDARLA